MSIRAGLGIAGFPFSGPRAFFRWVDACEESIADSIWISDRLVSTQPNLESLTAFAAIAGRTERIKFGMNAIVLPLRDPLVLAKECATVDYLSGGRLLPCFGVGAEAAPEFRATNRDPRGRGARADEMLQLLWRLWSEEDVTFEGEHYQYRNVTIAPRPVQQPLPVWIGGSSPAAIRRTATLGTGWLAGVQSPQAVAPVVKAIREASLAAGRPIDPDHYGAGFPFRFGAWEEPIVQRSAAVYARLGPEADPAASFAVGDADAILARAREYIDAGISKFVLRPLASGDDEFLDQTRRLIEDVLPRLHALTPPVAVG